MSGGQRVLFRFGAPLAALSVAGLTAWLATSRDQNGLGPMRTLSYAPPSSFDSRDAKDVPPPTLLEHISPVQAQLRNALLPYSATPLLTGVQYRGGAADATQALACLTASIYYEAGNEPLAGKRAVAQVILNRTASAPFPNTVCGVVQQGAPRPGCQFTFMCDGSLSRRPDPAGWLAAQEVAQRALSGEVDPDVGSATHYHADYVLPVWAPTMLKLVKIGHHIFYRWPGARLNTLAPSPLPPPDSAIVATSETIAPPATIGRSTALAADGEGAPPSPISPLTSGPADDSSTAATLPSSALSSSPLPEPKTQAQAERPQIPPHRAIPERSLRTDPF